MDNYNVRMVKHIDNGNTWYTVQYRFLWFFWRNYTYWSKDVYWAYPTIKFKYKYIADKAFAECCGMLEKKKIKSSTIIEKGCVGGKQ